MDSGGSYNPGVGHVPGSQYIGQWNWGAFLLCPFWLMNHGRVGRGILCLVLNFIPLGGLVSLGMSIAYGIKGNEVATTSRRFFDDSEYVAVQNSWRNAGILVSIVAIVFAVAGAGMNAYGR
jgi:hypothetical protein